MQYDPELFEAVKAIIINAHNAWGDYTASGAAYAILDEFEKHSAVTVNPSMEIKIHHAIWTAYSRVNACVQVRKLMQEAGMQLPPLRQTAELVDSVRTFSSAQLLRED